MQSTGARCDCQRGWFRVLRSRDEGLKEEILCQNMTLVTMFLVVWGGGALTELSQWSAYRNSWSTLLRAGIHNGPVTMSPLKHNCLHSTQY